MICISIEDFKGIKIKENQEKELQTDMKYKKYMLIALALLFKLEVEMMYNQPKIFE